MSTPTGAAALPMYDWPEVRTATDRLWGALRETLRETGIAAPDTLDRTTPVPEIWTHPRLVLAQTCGLPFVRTLHGRVTLLGSLDYALPDCPPGHYNSVIIVRVDDPRDTLAAFRGATPALNGRESQSGYAAFLHHAAPLAADGQFFGTAMLTGAHEASAGQVARGTADIAAIDHVSWGLITRFRPWSDRLRVLMTTDPTPGLPLITAADADPLPYARAIATAIASLDPATRTDLGLRGFQPFVAADYHLIRTRAAAAEARLSV